MSTTKSNNTSSSSGSGPSKFRKDAAIFSPNNYVHPATAAAAGSYIPSPTSMNHNIPMGAMNQQINPMAMGMMNMNMVNPQMSGNPMPMNGEPYYGGYNPYMMYPLYEFNPYASMQFVPSNYQYMPMYGQVPNMMNDANGMRPKRKSYKSQLSTPRSQATKSYESSPSVSTDATEQIPESVGEDEPPKSQDSIKEASASTEVEPEVVLETDTKDSVETKPEVAQEETIISKNLPLYINTSSSEFNKDKAFVSRRKSLLKRDVDQKKDLIISKPTYDLIDYNKRDSESSKGINDWASIVSSSVKKPKAKAPSTTQAKEAPVNATPASEAPSALPVREIDSIGLLSLKTMFNLLKFDEYFHINPRGLTNSGNICYMNSILQVLIYLEPFNKLFKLIDLKSVGSLNDSKTPFIDAMISIFKDFNTAGSKSLSPESFYMKLSNNSKFSHLKWGQQEDAEEFLGHFLDGLHEEFVKSINEVTNDQLGSLIENVNDNETKLQIKSAIKLVRKLNNHEGNDSNDINDDDDDVNEGWNEISVGSKKISSKRTVEIEPSPIKTIFGGHFRSVLQVPNKKDQSITLDPFQCIQLDIKDDKINTIEEAFTKLNEPEQIPFKLKDNNEVTAKKQTFIDSLPEVMIIHLKRFSFETTNNGNIEKLRKKIKYDHNLSVPIELFSNWRKNINREYKLVGVVYHHGAGAEGGHYTADVLKQSSLSETEGWIRIDDTSINKITKDDALNDQDDIKNAYILFYQKL